MQVRCSYITSIQGNLPPCRHRKTPVFVKSAETAADIATSFGSDRICPIFQLSNVTGQGLDFLRTFLNLLPSSEGDKEKFAVDQPFEVRHPFLHFTMKTDWISVLNNGGLVRALCRNGREWDHQLRGGQGRRHCYARPRLKWKLHDHDDQEYAEEAVRVVPPIVQR